MTLLTIGYQGRSLNDLKATLNENRVRVVLDVRERAWSRKPGFSKSQLSQALADDGIAYFHDPRLGSPKPIRDALRETGDWRSFARSFRTHLQRQREVLRDHADALEGETVCLLCFEAPVAECHRSIVAEFLGAMMETEPAHL